MPNLMRTQYNDARKHLTDAAKHLLTIQGRDQGFRTQQSQRVSETVKSFSDGLGGLIDNCYSLYRKGNKGRELQAEAGKALAVAQGYMRKIEDLEKTHELAELHLGEIAQAKTILGSIIHCMQDTNRLGMNVQHHYYDR